MDLTDEEKRGTCYFSVYIYWYTVLVISVTVAAISVDRFLFIVKPHLHNRFMRPWIALTLTIVIWILAAPLTIVQFYGFNHQYSASLYCSLKQHWFFIYVKLFLVAIVILRLHYRSGPNCAEPNYAGPAVQTMLAWFGPAHFSSVL